MSWRSKILGFVEVLLRVPPLFLIDEILKVGLGISDIIEHDLNEFKDGEEPPSYYNNFTKTYLAYDPLFYKYLLISFTRLTVGILGTSITAPFLTFLR